MWVRTYKYVCACMHVHVYVRVRAHAHAHMGSCACLGIVMIKYWRMERGGNGTCNKSTK